MTAKGKYIFQVKSTAFFDTETIASSSVPLESPRLLNITVSGVEPYTKCITCPPGTVSSEEGSSECTPCSNNQYAADSSTCSDCPEGKYAPAGSAECLDKVACGVSDFLPVVGECSAGEWNFLVIGFFLVVRFFIKINFLLREGEKVFEESRSDMGTVLCKLFSYFYAISLSHSSGVVNTVFRFVSFRINYKGVCIICT